MLRCVHCGADIVWHQGNGGQWLGAHPPRDWTTCGGRASEGATRHRPSLPRTLDPADVEAWLDA